MYFWSVPCFLHASSTSSFLILSPSLQLMSCSHIPSIVSVKDQVSHSYATSSVTQLRGQVYTKIRLPYPVVIQVLGQRWSPEVKVRGSANVLPEATARLTGQEVIYMSAVVKWWLAGGMPKKMGTKYAPQSLRLPQILQEVTRDWTRGFAGEAIVNHTV
jgi:hypothetical protein